MASRSHQPIVFIVGPTASGKTALAVELARKAGGEIIAADSRTIYKGMDIGTAKPSKEEQASVPHHGLDLVEPGERFTASDFKNYALQKIDEIRARGHIPFIVGGTGLYVDSVLFDYQFGSEPDPAQHAELEQKTVEELQEYCKNNNIELPENLQNKRYLIRQIEQQGTNTNRRDTPVRGAIVVGIATNTEQLKQRIKDRSEQLFEQGMVEEAKLLGKRYGWESEAMTANIYRLVHEFEQGTMTESQLKERFAIADWQLAKRQLTWLKRNSFIHWLGLSEAEEFVLQSLGKQKYSGESNMIDALFGSKTRVKLLHLFLNHPGQSFYVREITRLIDEQINSVRRELANMLEVGVITSDNADNKLYYEVNQRYEYYLALRAIFANEPIDAPKPSASEDQPNEQYGEIIKEVSPNALRLAIVAGVLVRGSTSPLDVLLVGNLPQQKVKNAMQMIEKLEGRELNYSVLPYDEFYYRLSIRDRFIMQVVNGKHSVIIDKDNVLSQN